MGVEQAYREHWARLLALLTGQFRDMDLAEDALQDAFADAVRTWRNDGVPSNPAAWLLTTARRRALDRMRREASNARRMPLLVVDGGEPDLSDMSAIPDERLRLIFTCCHPALAQESRVALTLRCVGGLTTPEIARLFLVSETTMAARIGRAKKKIAMAGIPYRVPESGDLAARLDGVLAVVYLIFTQGYADRAELAPEAVRLGRVLAELLPREPEALGLLALMMLQHARRLARFDGDGALVLLADQDRELWRWNEIADGLAVLNRALVADSLGTYAIQASIAAHHATARQAGDTDWERIAVLYAELERLTGSPVVRLNRAVAVAEWQGPGAALNLLAGLDELLPRHHRLPATRAELLSRLGRDTEAVEQYDRALELVGDNSERTFLCGRRDVSARRAAGR